MTEKKKVPFLRESEGVRTSVTACGIKLDFSRERITREDFAKLTAFAEKRGILEAHRHMVAGDVVNVSEGRQALHTSLRAFSSTAPMYGDVARQRERMLDFARRVRAGIWKGCRGDRITDIINIGIGGSEMGPMAVYHALRSSRQAIRVHFLSSVDGILLERILDDCNPLSTLIVVSSKSFSTRESLVNAAAVDQWLLNAGIVGTDRNRHMVVVSANPDAANQMCLPPENFFHFWKWVGGRFSVWGAVGLPLAVALGPEVFLEFLHGAEEMDRHSINSPIDQNMPALLAMFEYWESVHLGIPSLCVLPYDERLRIFVSWLQQLEMESLGKHRTPDGRMISGHTGQAVWGANGNEGQHSFYQWLREGTGSTSIDLIWSELPGHRYAEHFRVLLANARSQAEALVTRDEATPYMNTLRAISLDAMTPRRLGALMAMYEHKTTMLGTLFGINPFDQPGVELGKKLSRAAESGEDPQRAVEEVVKGSEK
ncbi:MAG: Glucose-6-phosphate isomerase [Burkholderia sp.]|jgi:glucose-6-phosphate isomerase